VARFPSQVADHQPLEVRLEPLEVDLEPLEVDLESLEVDLKPLEVRLESLEVGPKPLEVDLKSLEVRLESLEMRLKSLEVGPKPLEVRLGSLEVRLLRLKNRPFWLNHSQFHKNHEINQKTKPMKRNNFYPTNQGGQAIWLANWITKLPGYAVTLGLSPAQVAAILADARWLLYLLQTWLPAVRNWSVACTNAVSEAQTGSGTEVQVLPVFTAPALPDLVVPVIPSALNRIFAQIQLIKDSGKCTDSIAADLDILGSDDPGPDYTSIQPVISVRISGNQVFIKWGWGGYTDWLDSCELQVDRNDGKGFVFLSIDTTPGYTDTQPFPAAHTVWTYRAIYRVGEGQVGLWSQPVSIAVPV